MIVKIIEYSITELTFRISLFTFNEDKYRITKIEYRTLWLFIVYMYTYKIDFNNFFLFIRNKPATTGQL